MKNKFFIIAMAVGLLLSFGSCNKQLDQKPDHTVTADSVYGNMVTIKQALAKVYGSYALTSSTGNSNSDLGQMDAGGSDFLRSFWCLEELPTDESMCVWGDAGISDLNYMSWSSSNQWCLIGYDRSMFIITIATQFLQNTANPPSSFTQAQLDTLQTYRAEARWVRAFQYWALMDLFGNPPFINDNSPIGTNFMPPQIKRDSLFNWIESELKAIAPQLAAPRTNEYGRIDRAGAWALLARMYLNAQVYTGTPRWTDAITYADSVINVGYSLMPQYKNLFLADNNINNQEVIFPIPYDANNAQNYGGTTYLVNAMVGGNTPGWSAGAFGINTSWAGDRARQQFPQKFGSDITTSTDARAALLSISTATNSMAQENGVPNPYLIVNPGVFDQGIETTKWRNVNSDGSPVPGGGGEFCSIDFPLFRLAEMYLIYAEAVLRGGQGGSQTTALSYINALRTRSNASAIGSGDLNLQFILDERARELYTEGFRRTDLIRYGQFTTSAYIWDWKGGVQGGSSVDSHYNLYPLPSSDISVNSNLQQNPGY